MPDNRERGVEGGEHLPMTWPVERKYPRVKVALAAETRHPMENFPRRGQTANLSEGGCYIEMIQTIEPPMGVEVTLWLGEEKIQARAEVVSRHAHLGNGIRFVRMPEADKQKLRAFLETAKTRGLPFANASE
jgi:hypothetical protein